MSQGVPPADPPPYTHRQVLRVLPGVLTCLLLAAVDQTVVIPAVPAIAADLKGFDSLAWIVSAYLLTATCSTPIYGRLSDIHGRRAVMIPVILLFMAASLCCALAQTMGQLIAARALQGLAGGGLMAMAQAVIADVVSPRERGRYQGYMASTWASASVAGPVLGGWVTDHLSWHWIFWINLPLGLVALALAHRALRELRPRPPMGSGGTARIDLPGAALLSLCITAALLVMTWGGHAYPWTSPVILGTAAAAAGLLALLVAHQGRTPHALLPPSLFANRVVSAGIAIAALAMSGMLGGTFLLPLYFQLVHGVDAATSGTMLVPFLVSSAMGAFLAGNLARRWGRTRRIILGGMAVAILGMGTLAAFAGTLPPWAIVADVFVIGLGLGCCMPTSMVTVQNAAGRQELGTATGALLLLRQMGGAFGSTLAGALLASRFADGLAARGLSATIDLGALRGRTGSLAALDEATRTAAREAAISGFQWGFASSTLLLVLALLVAWRMRDLPLRQ
jgi:EmrB/QacA subfamily drug resistance transporter